MPFAELPGVEHFSWMNLLINLGGFGLLAWIVIYFAPRALKDMREEREKVAADVREERNMRDQVFERIITMLQVKFEERSREVTAAVNQQTAVFAKALDDNAGRIEAAVKSACKSDRKQ